MAERQTSISGAFTCIWRLRVRVPLGVVDYLLDQVHLP